MIVGHRALGRNMEAYMLMQKMQMLNRSSISRLVAMGETQLALNDDRKAEHYFKSALEKDAWCSGALNGIAEIRFRQGDLDTARTMLEKSSLSYRYASKLNMDGIEMVRRGRYGEALEHYSKAQYVLPQQEKGPQLFYNIGLCYSRWNKPEMAVEFLKLAIIKEPNYKKAQKLMDQIQQHSAHEGMIGNLDNDTPDVAS
jgi:Tfp pilus assembly protein PilF